MVTSEWVNSRVKTEVDKTRRERPTTSDESRVGKKCLQQKYKLLRKISENERVSDEIEESTAKEHRGMVANNRGIK